MTPKVPATKAKAKVKAKGNGKGKSAPIKPRPKPKPKPKPKPRGRGQPTTYADGVGLAICERIAAGEVLAAICASPGMPAESTAYLWLHEHRLFSEMYARAREIRADKIAEGMLEIADDGRNDWMEQLEDGGEGAGYRINGEHVQRSRLRVDTRKWLLAKMAPRKYGEKIEHAHGGSEHLPPIKQEISTKTPEQAAQIYRERLA